MPIPYAQTMEDFVTPTPERIVAQFWYSEILNRVDSEVAVPYTVQRGANAQPGGTLPSEGTVPGIACSRWPGRAPGIDASSPRL